MDPIPDTDVDRGLRLAMRIWIGFTVSIVLGSGVLLLTLGSGALEVQHFLQGARPRALIQEGPSSTISLTLSSVVIVWLFAGASLFLMRKRGFRARHGLALVSTFIIVILYTNVLRERTAYGDFVDYLRAAQNLANRSPFHDRYLYPPLAAAAR